MNVSDKLLCTLARRIWGTEPNVGVIISQPVFRFLVVIFDGDHDFEGLRSPRAHLDTVLRNLSRHLGTPRTLSSGDNNALKPLIPL